MPNFFLLIINSACRVGTGTNGPDFSATMPRFLSWQGNATGATITSPGSSRNWRTLAYFTQLLNLNTLTCCVKMFQILLQVLQTIWVLSCSRITKEQNAPSYLKFVQQKRVDNHAAICCRKSCRNSSMLLLLTLQLFNL